MPPKVHAGCSKANNNGTIGILLRIKERPINDHVMWF